MAYVSHNLNEKCNGLFWGKKKIKEEKRRIKFYGLKQVINMLYAIYLFSFILKLKKNEYNNSDQLIKHFFNIYFINLYYYLTKKNM